MQLIFILYYIYQKSISKTRSQSNLINSQPN